MRTFISRIRSTPPQSTTLPSMTPFMPPPVRYSKPSTRRMSQPLRSMSSAKQGARSDPEAQIMVPA